MDGPGLGDFDLTGIAPPPPTGWATWPPAARGATGCGIGCALLVVLQCVAVWLLYPLAFGRADYKAAVQSPKRAVVGKPFPLTLVVHNTSAKPLLVSNIAVRNETQATFLIANPQPAPQSTTMMMGVQTWTYSRTLAPGEKWTLHLDATAKQAGELNGSLEVQAPFIPHSVHFDLKAVTDRK